MEAARWYKKAALQGHAPAQVRLGNYCSSSSGYDAAIQWYLKAAAQGDAQAQYELGLQDGHGMPQDASTASQWFQKSAVQGHAGACYELGSCYHDGEGVPEDLVEALKWLRISASAGDDEMAVARAEFVEQQLTESEIEEAQRRADAIKPTKHANA